MPRRQKPIPTKILEKLATGIVRFFEKGYAPDAAVSLFMDFSKKKTVWVLDEKELKWWVNTYANAKGPKLRHRMLEIERYVERVLEELHTEGLA